MTTSTDTNATSKPLLDQDKVTQLVAVIQASVGHLGVTVAAECRGRWLDIRCDYEDQSASVRAALDLRRLMIKSEIPRALDDLSHVARRVAHKLVSDHGAALRAERIALHGECDHGHGNRGAIKCTLCGDLMPAFGGVSK